MLASELWHWLAASLIAFGPGLIFLACLLETAVFAGLVLPVGALIAFGAMLAARGVMDPTQIVAAAFLGALVGDQLGFVVGRWFVVRARPPRGGIARIWRAALSQVEILVRRRGLLGITAARGIPFVRTLMPWFAGRSGITWGKFLLFDFLGLLVWAAIYIGGGFAAGEGWRQVAGRYGEIAGALVVALAVLAVLVVTRRLIRGLVRRRARRRRVPASTEGPSAGVP